MAEASAENAPAKKAPAKKTAAKKTPAKEAPAKKAPAKKAPAKKGARKAPAKTSVDDRNPTKGASPPKAPARRTSARTEAPSSRRGGSGQASGAARAAREAVLDLTGKSPEGVTGLERTDDGWRVEVDVLELERIPSTTDVLATYEVTLDDGGELQGCRRVRRFLRGSAGDD